MQMIDKTARHAQRRAIGLRYYFGAAAMFAALVWLDPTAAIMGAM